MTKEKAKKQRKERETPLSERQVRFIAEYMRSGNGAESAVTAGYSAKNPAAQARKLIKNPLIAKRMRELTNSFVSHKVADVREILEFLTKSMRGEVLEPIQIGYKLQMVKPPVKSRVSAAKEILKRYPTDEMSKAQIRKILADARLSEAKAKQLETGGHDVDDSLANVLSRIRSADEKTTK